MAEYEFVLFQDGLEVVGVSAGTEEEALREVWHYTLLYLQEGSVTIKQKKPAEFLLGDCVKALKRKGDV